jgi:hypothetical protein
VPLALRTKKINFHMIWFILVLLIAIFLPLLGRAFVFEPISWFYWVMSFPLSIFFGAALQSYFDSPKKASYKIVRNFAALAVLILVVISVTYSVTSPLSPSPYSIIGATFASSQPLGYLQSTIPTSQEGDLISLLRTSLSTLPNNSTLYLGEQFYGLSLILPNANSIRLMPVGLIDSEANLSSIVSLGSGYTVWWTNPTGWYGVNTIPSNFIITNTVGAFTLYHT